MGRVGLVLLLVLIAGCDDPAPPVDAGSTPPDAGVVKDAGAVDDAGLPLPPYDCDESAVFCDAIPPVCPPGEVGEVGVGCWTWRCVPITDCYCTGPAMCPDPGSYTCHGFAMRCGPYL